ncbi:MAG: MobA/MobL family protein [Gallionella sp.]|nr:MobA/MobL family protein [Gallionella sp.]
MAFAEGHFHCRIDYAKRGGKKLCARAKHDYNHRFGRWAEKHEGPLAFAESGNMPAWADSPRTFWETADQLERANGTFYFNAELAIPVELSTLDQKRAVMREYKEKLIGEKHPYSLTMHDNEGNPHCDLMWSTRTLDDIERSSPEHFFKQAMKDPARGGCRKAEYNKEWIVAARKLWEEVCNKHLEAAGSNVRIDHRSYAERGIEKAPGVHLGQKVHRLEKAGISTWRGIKNRGAQHLNASLQEVQSKIKPKEKPNEQRPGRNGNPHQHTTRCGGTRAASERAFTAWDDRGSDRPGLRSSRHAGPERMPTLRQQRAGDGLQETRNPVLQRTLSGHRDGNHRLHSVPGAIYTVEALDRRQLYKARILQQQYQQEIQTALAARLAYVDRQPDRIAITLKGGGSVTDHGDRLLTKAGRSQEILAALALAKAKGWKQIQITGAESFKARAYVEAARAGLAVVGYSPAPELRAQLEKEKTMADQAGAGGMMALTPDITAGHAKPASRRWLEPLRAAREKLEAERKAAKEKLDALPAEADIQKVEQELAVALGGQRYLDARRKFKGAAAAAKDAGVLTRKRAEAKKEEAWQALLALHDKVLAEPGAAKHLAHVRHANQEREQSRTALIRLQNDIGEIEYLERELQKNKGFNPEPDFQKAWRSRNQHQLKPWQKLALAPVFEADAAQERARQQAEAEAENQVKQAKRQAQIRREIEAQQQADAIQDQLCKPGLTAEQEEALEQQHRYYLAVADGHDEEEARERAAKKSDALRL